VRHREHVAGLALIDSSHPDMHTRLSAGAFFTRGRGAWLLYAVRWRLTPLGLVRLADDLGVHRQITDRAQRIYPPDAAAAGRALMLSSRQRRAYLSEMTHIRRSCDEARACLADLGTLPLAIVTSSEHDPAHAPGSPAALKRSLWYTTTWSVLQADFARLSSNSSHTVAERSGHYIHRDDPDLVTSTSVILHAAHVDSSPHIMNMPSCRWPGSGRRPRAVWSAAITVGWSCSDCVRPLKNEAGSEYEAIA
jgi:pimeloyl-ACP methyl ester carboxylesterase